jgi:regulator of cell morphogenesis and NO signaling
MMKEEMVLFPYIKKMAAAHRDGAKAPDPGFGTIANPIRMMQMEHDSAGNYTERIRELSKDFTVPEDACASYRLLYGKLEEFEGDLLQHIHLENNILFPKSIEMEKETA